MNSDRLNPLVIKELRQGLKSRSFLATFLGLQAGMVLSMFLYLSTAVSTAGQANLLFANAFFWGILGVMLLLFMPLRAFSGLHDEMKGKTLEMLLLTRMDAWKIVFGKWCALVVQVFLLVSAVLPYLVLRYFLGAIDVAGNLVLLLVQVVLSMLFVSVGLGISGWSSKLLRGLVITGALLPVGFIPFLVFGYSISSGGGPFSFSGWLNGFDCVVYLVCAAILMMLFVEYGASQISPPAENHALRKRLLMLGLVGVMSPYAFFKEHSGGLEFCMLVFVPVAIDALCEPLNLIPSVYRRLQKLGPCRWLFYPGWVSGFFFVTLIFLILNVLVSILVADVGVWTGGLAVFNTLIFPFFLMRLFSALNQNPLLSYVVVQVLSFFGGVFISPLGLGLLLGQFFPLMGVFSGVDEWHPFLLGLGTTGMLTVCFVKARDPFKQMQALSQGVAV